jgi:adenine C2-methylase RlmN of 23S rRNA A2503 and tRNA A37
MCHLTATKQTQRSNATLDIYREQTAAVLNWYDENCPKAKIVHFNFMSRGEAFDNELFIKHGKELFDHLGAESSKRSLFPRFLISTIMPQTIMDKSLSDIFPIINPEIYYSIYSVNPDFRKKWLPNAMPPIHALKLLKEYQDNTKKIIKLHWAFIEGENDSEEDIALLCHRVRTMGLRVDIAIVKFNPYSSEYGKESSIEVIDRNVEILKSLLPFSKIKMIARVGFDVKASCGMFVGPKGTWE